MDYFVRGFIRASLIWLGVGVVLGVVMTVGPPEAIAYRPVHMHANLLGFVSMMIFGVAYHVIPRFTGAPLHDRRLAGVHLVVANAGLFGLATGWMLRAHAMAGVQLFLAVGALLSASGAFLFIYNVWRTLDRAVPAMRPTPAASAEITRLHTIVMQSRGNGGN